jgi:UDP-N-acetylmuramyl tripeptide synthase
MILKLTDSRRLTGANLYWEHPSAIIDVAIDGPAGQVIEEWRTAAMKWLDVVGFADQRTCVREFEGGASLLISAPIDVLYSMCELNEVAWASAISKFDLGSPPDSAEEAPRLNRLFDEERNPALLRLQSAASERDVPFLWDDDEVSVGYGRGTQIWKPNELPAPEDIDWSALHSVPLVLVTGTNGKSTTVRMTAAIMTAAGRRAGLTSTDFIRVADRTIDTGDYSGTGGARMLMRQQDLEMAVLEVARGGLLRRGLGVERADVAVVTNVAADHLGEYGINTVDDLVPAKFIVHRAIGPGGTLVLNADDTSVERHGAELGKPVAWFSLDSAHPRVLEARAGTGMAAFQEDGALWFSRDGESRRVAEVADIPATRGGLVRYNISNALAAMTAALLLGISDEAVRRGLASFQGDENDNPGRGNWFEHPVEEGVVRILVDFAHNEHGMRALADAVLQVGAQRVTLLMGQAGDRLDKDIADLVRAACSMNPDRLLVAELPGYERGRQAFEVPTFIRKQALELGISEDKIEIFSNPSEATAMALEQAQAGDLLVLLALTQRQEALSLVHEFIGDD